MPLPPQARTLALVSMTLLAAAGAREAPRPRQPVDVPFSSRSAGIPGPDHPCVKACEFDMNPCDPPAFKHADGRCSGG